MRPCLLLTQSGHRPDERFPRRCEPLQCPISGCESDNETAGLHQSNCQFAGATISLYNAEGYYEKNPYDAYTLNDITAKKNQDGSVTIQFGGCDGKIPNCLPITKGWNYMVRLYRPRAEILNGTWKFPDAQPVN
jgi:hypothetical protein